ncbi:MAG: site-specific integrase [Chloroflexota bacterium]
MNEGRVDGRRRRRPYYGKTRKEVAEKLKVALRSQQQGLPLGGDGKTLASFLSEWLEGQRSKIRATTWRRYSELAGYATKLIGAIALEKLTPEDVERLLETRLKAGAAPATVRQLRAVLRRALGQAEKRRYVQRNAAALASPPRVERRQMTALTEDQANALLEAAKGDRLEALYAVALDTGMREGELLALKWAEVDLERGTLQVRATLQATPDGYEFAPTKTAKSRRQVTLTRAAVTALRRHRVRQNEERMALGTGWTDIDLVYANAVGRPVNASNLLHQRFHPLLKRADLPRIRFHDLRHTYATIALGRGVPLKVVSDTLGHSSIAITADTYMHVTPSMSRAAADAMDAVHGT